jgi:hypothetical protein
MQELLARMLFVVARPLQPRTGIESLVRHAREHRREGAHLVPRVLRRWIPKLLPEPLRDLRDDPDVVARLTWRLQSLATALHAALAVRDGAFGLAPARRGGEDHMRHLRGARQEDVLHHEVVEPLQQPLHAVQVGIALRRVLADDVQPRELSFTHRVEHLREIPAVVGLDFCSPRLAELLANVRIQDVLESGEAIRDRPHVAAALDVVLSAQRVQPAAVTPDFARQ